jgi:hypothetical protein
MRRNHSKTNLELTMRKAVAGDALDLERLAALDSAPLPEGPLLVAESDGRLLAAMPLAGGPAIADPFAPTAAVIELLELRSGQLRASDHNGRKPLAGVGRLRSLLTY